jgi:hypothetical protein
MQIIILILTFILKTSLINVVLLALLFFFVVKNLYFSCLLQAKKRLTIKLKTQLRSTTYKEK